MLLSPIFITTSSLLLALVLVKPLHNLIIFLLLVGKGALNIILLFLHLLFVSLLLEQVASVGQKRLLKALVSTE